MDQWDQNHGVDRDRGEVAREGDIPGLQVHGGGKPADNDGKFVRYRNIRVKKLGVESGK
jgi:hypothetical protein